MPESVHRDSPPRTGTRPVEKVLGMSASLEVTHDSLERRMFQHLELQRLALEEQRRCDETDEFRVLDELPEAGTRIGTHRLNCGTQQCRISQ
ncbi:MAG: hypothetical protein Q7J82_02945 [Coriobacteriia bacterium]|nr:hypothetical protein [Coriobacteriia bacterium]